MQNNGFNNRNSRANDLAIYFLWTLFCLLLIATAIQDHLHNPDTRWWEPIVWEGTSVIAATFWFIRRRRMTRHFEQYLDRPLLWIGHQLKWLPLVALVFITAVYSVRHGVYALLGTSYLHEPWWFLFLYETLKLGLFMGLWLGILFGFESFAQLQLERERALITQKALAEAQLSQLKAQLQPHFLFNALNTISSLMQTDVAQADRLLARVGDLLRASLQAGKQNLTSLHEELKLLELYAQIMQERFGDRVELQWEINANATNASVPSLLLQPLLENSFKHGVERSSSKVIIRVTARRIHNQLDIAIHNTKSALASRNGQGIGVQNCRERLQALYGEQAGLVLTADSTGVTARIAMPYSESPL